MCLDGVQPYFIFETTLHCKNLSSFKICHRNIHSSNPIKDREVNLDTEHTAHISVDHWQLTLS